MRALGLACKAGDSSKRLEIRVTISFIMVSIGGQPSAVRAAPSCTFYMSVEKGARMKNWIKISIYTYVRASIHAYSGD